MAASQQQYDALKQAVGSLGFVCTGSVVKRFMPCGVIRGAGPQADPPQLHGPYLSVELQSARGKTVGVHLNEAQAMWCEEWLHNHRQLRVLVRRMEALSLRETDRLLRALANPKRAPLRKSTNTVL